MKLEHEEEERQFQAELAELNRKNKKKLTYSRKSEKSLRRSDDTETAQINFDDKFAQTSSEEDNNYHSSKKLTAKK